MQQYRLKQIFLTIFTLWQLQCIFADLNAIKEIFKDDATIETENFLNGMFQGQIDFFERVKPQLPPNTKRVSDIGIFVKQLQQAIQEKDIQKKDALWRDTFMQFNDSPLLLNNESETGLTKSVYEEILQKSGLKQMGKTLLQEVAVYVWKMAKISGKAMEITIDEHLERLRQAEERQQ